MKANGKLKVEKGVPVPLASNHKGHADLLRSMKVGDSIELPTTANAGAQSARQVFGPKHVTVRKTEKGCRIWRLA